jgi:hypothetical protein
MLYRQGDIFFQTAKKKKDGRILAKLLLFANSFSLIESILAIGAADDRRNAFEITENKIITLPPPKLPTDVYIFHGVASEIMSIGSAHRTAHTNGTRKPAKPKCFSQMKECLMW